MSDIKVVKVLVDPKRVATLLTDQNFISMVAATKRHQAYLVKLYCNTLEHSGYTIQEITAAVECVG